MHEASLMENIRQTALRQLAPYKVKKVNELSVVYGPLANIIPAALQFAFEAIAQDGILQGAVMRMRLVPVELKCLSCDAAYQAAKPPFICPSCGSRDFAITGGTDVVLEWIDFDEAEDD